MTPMGFIIAMVLVVLVVAMMRAPALALFD
jgi:hypothetical protein